MYTNLWLIHVDIWQKPTQHCKAINLQLKQKVKKKKRVALPRGKYIPSGKMLCNTRNSAWCSMTTERGGMGVDVKEAQEGGNTCALKVDSGLPRRLNW